MIFKQTHEQVAKWRAKLGERAAEMDRYIVGDWEGGKLLDKSLPGWAELWGRPAPSPQPSRGLGDTIAKAIQAVTLGKVKPCGGCKKRQEKLNKLLPYKKDGE